MGRTEYRCPHCGVNLGLDPWLGLPNDPHPRCGCFPSKGQKMIARPTKQEMKQAVLDSRQHVAEYLASIQKLAAFDGFSKDDICGLIYAAHEAVQASLRVQCREAFDGEIPY